MKIKLPYHQIEFDKILSNDVYVFKNEKNNIFILNKIYFLFKLILTTLYQSTFYSPLIKKNSKYSKIFYIRTLDREDIKKNSIYYQQIRGTSVCILEKKIKKINFATFVYTIVDLFKSKKYWMKVFKKNEIRLFSYYGFFLITKLYKVYSETLKIIPAVLKHEKLVSYQQCLPTENMICQLANLNKIKTYGLQASLNIYQDSKIKKNNLIDYDYFKILDYLNPVCKNVLCWGVINKSLYKKFTKANIFIVGKAGLPKFNCFEVGVTIIFEPNDFQNTNNKLLQISNFLENNQVKVSRWFKKGHFLVKNGIKRDGPLRKLVVGFHSTLLAELGFLGAKVYVCRGSNFENLLPSNLIINNLNEIQKKINLKKKYPHEIWKNFIQCSGKESVKKYKSVLI
jgi:hypothetical protein